MRVYKVGEPVRLSDNSIAMVVKVIPGPYKLPEGQILGSNPSETGGEYQYDVKLGNGTIKRVQDREVYNVPRVSTGG